MRIERPVDPIVPNEVLATAGQNKFKRIMIKVAKVAKIVLFVAACAALYFFNPNVFAVSFVVGFLAKNKCQKELIKVKDFIKHNPWIATAVIGAGAFLALPVAWMVLSVGCGMNLGVKLANRAEKQRLARTARAA